MADQKEMKRRLKVLMKKPENQICSDCPERQPRWASLIVPPPGAPPGSTKIGAFCCLECSGSHRRLGVHISFVRSINLDSWKEAEVLAMENGGNGKVNAIWEANLQRAGGRKPGTGADLSTRERYVREKYERRRFYDGQALVEYQNSEPSFDDIGSKNHGGDFANFGPPADASISDAAKARADKKKKKLSKKQSFDEPAARTRSTGSNGRAAERRMKNQPAAQPAPVVDLLDLGGGAPASNGAPAGGAPFADFFSADATNGAAPVAPTGEVPKRKSSRDGSRSRSQNRDSLRTKSKTPDRKQAQQTQQLDIMSMYNTPSNPGMGAGQMNPAAAMNNPANMMAMMQQMQQMNMNPNQQQPQAGGADAKHNTRLAAHQNLMMQQMRAQMQQQQNMQQMQRMMQQQGGAGGMNPQMMQGMNPQMMQQQMMQQMNPKMMQAMLQQANQANKMPGGMPNMQGGGMPNMQMGMNPNMMMMGGMNPNMMAQQQQQQPQFQQNMGGKTMGGMPNATQQQQVPEKEDPFAQFGMNAFR